jgi:hypothetical protein
MPYQYKSKMKDALGSPPDPCAFLSPTDCTVFCSEQSLTVYLVQVNLSRTGAWVAWPGYGNAMHSTGGHRRACLHEVLSLLFVFIPWMLGPGQLSTNRGQQRKSRVCMLTDRQLSLLLKGHQRPKARPQLPPAPECLHTVYKSHVIVTEIWTNLSPCIS